MNFIISASTNVGTTKNINEDSAIIRRLMTPGGEAVLAAVCDGVGGLSSGEIASASVVCALGRWFLEVFPALYMQGMTEQNLFQSWFELVQHLNTSIGKYGQHKNMHLGTTLSAFLIVDNVCYIMNVGDSRVYEITEEVRLLTHDQTLVAEEVERGIISPEEAASDPRRNIILQCIGESEEVFPEFRTEMAKTEAVYMACSDGFRHVVTDEEIRNALGPDNRTEEMLQEGLEYLIHLNMSRHETDNISAVAARTYIAYEGCGDG